MKYFLSVLLLVLTLAVTIAKPFLQSQGISTDTLLITLVVIVCTSFLQYRNLLLAVLVIGLVALANFPDSILAAYRIDRQWIIGTLVAVIVAPLIGRRFGLNK